MHVKSNPAILYFGTPVVLISTKNPNGTDNIAPMSSIFWLGWRCMIGLGSVSKTAQNLLQTKECVLNLPSAAEAAAVNSLAMTTGANPVPNAKVMRGYRYVENKFELANLTREQAETVNVCRIQQCPVQLEAKVVAIHGIGEEDEQERGKIFTFELKVTAVHLEESILMDGHTNRVDPDKWKPLIMSFQEFYTLGEKVSESALATIPENLYKTVDKQPQDKN